MASTLRATPTEVFDASKQAKAPSQFFSNAPRDAPAVRVGLVSPAIGYGLFAARDFAKDEFLFHEAPLMTALFNEKFAADQALMQSQVAAFRAALAGRHRAVTALAFPAPAARLGVAPPPFDDAARTFGELGRNLAHGRFDGSNVSREQYGAYTASINAAPSPSEADARAACLDFFKHYAFEVDRGAGGAAASGGGGGGSGGSGGAGGPGASTRQACIYLLGSLINHCCTAPPTSSSSAFLVSGKRALASSNCDGNSSSSGSSNKELGPNCSWRIGPSGLAHFVRPRHICVQARRAIRAGEQLTWDYGKREKGFVCECDTCRDRFASGLGQMCAVV